jgi:hypothetical protein
MKRAKVQFTHDVLRRLLGIRKDIDIIGVKFYLETNMYEFFLTGSSMPEQPEGQRTPLVDAKDPAAFYRSV